jgi:hypothetical protein
VHRGDAERAAGREHALDPVVATDGIEEYLTGGFCSPSTAGAWRPTCRSPATSECWGGSADATTTAEEVGSKSAESGFGDGGAPDERNPL